jgi:outer membrane lipoprotein SlyB
MNTNKDYLSEFEREFEIDSFSSESQANSYLSDESEYELEGDFSDESNEEIDTHDEYELDDEYESADQNELEDEVDSNEEYEFDNEAQDSELENYLQEYDSPDQEFEERLYSALSGEYESSFEMEQEIDRVLHEMEVEYFWKAAKNLWKKHRNKFKKLIPGGAITGLAKLAGGDVRGLLKQGLTMAANAYLPGVGGAIAGKLLNSEMPNANNARAQARQTVRVAKDTYRNMARLVPNLRPGNVPNQIRSFSNQALAMAQKRHSVYSGKSKKVIKIKSGSIVVVRPDRIIIYS